MGNQNMGINLQPENISLNTSESLNLQIYRWRALSSCSKFISRVILEPKSEHLNNSICSIGIQQTNLLKNYQLFFQSYVCSFQSLKHTLKLQESIYVFQSLLYGYESIYNKFGKVIIHPKCIFLTPKGQIRVWINPNYFLNEFWNSQNKFTDFQKCQIQKLKTKIPKFIKVRKLQENFIFSHLPTILHQTIQLARTFLSLQELKFNFFYLLQSFISSNLQNSNFLKLHQFVNLFLNENHLNSKNCINQLPIFKQKCKKSLKQSKLNTPQGKNQLNGLQFSQILSKNIFNDNKQNGKTSILMSKIQNRNKKLKKTVILSQTQNQKNSFTNDSTLKRFTEDPTLKNLDNISHQNMSLNDVNHKRFSQGANQYVRLQKSDVLDLRKSIFYQLLNQNDKKLSQKKQYQILPQYAMNINSFSINAKNINEGQQILKSKILKSNNTKNRHQSFSHRTDDETCQIVKKQNKINTLNFNPVITEWQNSKESSQIQKKNSQKKQYMRQKPQIRKKRSSQNSLQQAFLFQLQRQKDQIIQQKFKKYPNCQIKQKTSSQGNFADFDDFENQDIIINLKSPKNSNYSISKSQFAIQRTQKDQYKGQKRLRVSESHKYKAIFPKNEQTSSYISRNQVPVKTIRTLFSGNGSQKCCSSIGSMSSEYQNDSNPYSGILTQMGRSVTINKNPKIDADFFNTSRNFESSIQSNRQNEPIRQKLNQSLKL